MKNFIEEVKQPSTIQIAGCEALSVGESISAFFEEFGLSIDKKLGGMKSSIHPVNYLPVQTYLTLNKVNFVKNATKEITAPSHFGGEFGEMDYYVKNLINGIVVVNGLKTETTRLYDWLKSVVKTGRMDKSLTWSVTGYGDIIDNTDAFIKELEPDGGYFYLDQVYNSFENAFKLMNQYSLAVKSIKSRDIEILSKELSQVYSMGGLLVTKIQNNDIVLSQNALKDIQEIMDRFTHLVNLSGAIMGMLNELTAVFEAHLKEFKTLK